MVSVWIIPPIRQEYKVVGVIIDVIILGAGIVLVLDPWLIILLAILAALVIVGLIVKKGRE
jgi:hypothetical protein